jgi:hypothetical protein
MAVYNKFNRGEIDVLALARDDVAKVNNSCALMNNMIPLRLGPMQYKPGMEHIGLITGETYLVPFVAATTDTAILEFTNNKLRVWVDDVVLARTSVGSTITNPNFTSDISGWTDASGAGSSTAHDAGGYADLTGSGTTSAVLYQTVTVSGGDVSAEHGINIVIFQSDVLVKIGTSGASSDEIFNGVLSVGTHSLLITPASDFTVTLSNSEKFSALVDSVDIESTGELSFVTPIGTSELSTIRVTQSADVVFIAHNNGKILRVERRGQMSWSLVDYSSNDGPFGTINITDIALNVAALAGDTTLTASSSYFKTTHVGALFKLGSAGQQVTASVTAADSGTGSIRVTGVAASRQFNISITSLSGTGSTVTLQRSPDDATWVDVESYTTDQSKTFDDDLDNSILFYRLHVKAGDYVAGTIALSLDFAGGSIEGICRVTGFTSATVVDVQVLVAFGSVLATRDWFESQWSDLKGFPTATTLYEGRLWFAGITNLWGSVSDNFTSFDRNIEGDSKSIFKTIGFGPVESVHWLGESSRLIMGIPSDEVSVRSSSFGEILTQNNANLKSGSSQGSAPIAPVRIDDLIYYVQRSGVKMMELEYALGSDNHKGRDLMMLNQTICIEGIKRIATVRQPETRIIVVLDDGTARIYLFDSAENVAAWSRFDTPGGLIEDVVTLPGLVEDEIYFTVNRSGVRSLEKLALLSEYVDKHFDSFTSYVSPGTTLTGLDRFNGQTIGIWGDGVDQGDGVVSGGSLTVASFTNVTVGLRYTADYLSNKLGQYVKSGSTGASSRLTSRSRIVNMGLIAHNLHPNVLKYGPSFDLLDPLPDFEEDDDLNQYDNVPFEFNGTHDSDSRVALRITGPCVIMALTFNVKD